MSLVEFVSFLYGVKSGKHLDKLLPNKLLAIKRWYYSLRIYTLKLIIISHFQLSSSIKRAFPALHQNTRQQPDEASTTTGGVTFVFREAYVAAGATLANIDASIFEIVSCFVGPRYCSRLLITSLFLLGSLTVGGLLPRLIKLAHCK